MITSEQALKSEAASTYMQSWKKDLRKTTEYLQSRKEMSRQQQMLHGLIKDHDVLTETSKFADFGCGAGWSTYHLHREFGISEASLYDLSSHALQLAEVNLGELGISSLRVIHEDLAHPSAVPRSYFDVGVNMMTLCCVEEPFLFLKTLIDSIKPGGSLYVSTLYNRWHPNVDLEITQMDQSRRGTYTYKVFSESTLKRYIEEIDSNVRLEVYDFNISTELQKPEDAGIGTYTISSAENGLLEISGGALFQWSFIRFHKDS